MKVFLSDDLSWKKTAIMPRGYSFLSGFHTLGELKFDSNFGMDATAEFVEHKYQLYGDSFMRKVMIGYKGSENLIGTLKMNWMNSGTIGLNENEYTWKTMPFRSEYEFRNAQGDAIISFKMKYDISATTQVKVLDDTVPGAEMEILLALGMYVMARMGTR